MNREQRAVKDFHTASESHIEEKPHIPPKEVSLLRAALITEEANEFIDAAAEEDIIAVADALADLLYVVYGTAVSYGLDMEEIFREVHRSNMTKLPFRKRDDGKIIKSDSYEPPRLRPIIETQLRSAGNG